MKTKGGDWDWAHLAAYLHDPKVAIPGNKMAFPGIKDDAELADLLIYMRKLGRRACCTAEVAAVPDRLGMPLWPLTR